MRNTTKLMSAGIVALLLTGGLSAQQQAPEQGTPGQPTFRAAANLVTTDVIVRDSREQFVADLQPGEFEVYEDGVRQEIVSMVLTHGGRVFNLQSPVAPPVQEGIILPVSRPSNDAAGRVFLVFVDDLHFEFGMTSRARRLIQQMLENLIHEGDLFGIVTTGTSSISQQLTYDRQVLEASIKKISGNGMRPDDVVRDTNSSQGPVELRYRAHVAFRTAYELVTNLEQLQNRRKAVIYISSGYDFNPFETSRRDEMARRMGAAGEDLLTSPFYLSQVRGQQFAEADLIRELGELTRAANRANASFYTIDPRGLMAGADVDQEIRTQEWLEYVRETQTSLRVLADETGGMAVVNMNDFESALKRIDAETSDYYVLGYYSSNPDPLRRTRQIEVKATRPDLDVWSRTSYSLRLPRLEAP